jgi:hypothetical protein
MGGGGDSGGRSPGLIAKPAAADAAGRFVPGRLGCWAVGRVPPAVVVDGGGGDPAQATGEPRSAKTVGESMASSHLPARVRGVVGAEETASALAGR